MKKTNYPKDFTALVLISCMSGYLNGDIWHEFVLNVFNDGKLRKIFAINYLSKMNLEIIKAKPKRPEDIYIYNFIKFKAQMKHDDLLKRYYDLYVQYAEIKALHEAALQHATKKNLSRK